MGASVPLIVTALEQLGDAAPGTTARTAESAFAPPVPGSSRVARCTHHTTSSVKTIHLVDFVRPQRRELRTAPGAYFSRILSMSATRVPRCSRRARYCAMRAESRTSDIRADTSGFVEYSAP